MRSGVAFGIHCGTMASLRRPKVLRNSSCVSVTPAAAILSRQANQWYCSESTSVPSRSQRTDLVMRDTFLVGEEAHWGFLCARVVVFFEKSEKRSQDGSRG